MNSYFNLDIQESFPGEWQEYLNDVDPKYHLVLTRAMSSLHYFYGDKAYKCTDEWFTILYGSILELEDTSQRMRDYKVATGIDEHVYRVIDDEGNFAKPVSTGHRTPTKPNERRYSQAKGLYLTESRARAAIRGGVGTKVQKASIGEWQDVD
jgi:hypothetical protein